MISTRISRQNKLHQRVVTHWKPIKLSKISPTSIKTAPEKITLNYKKHSYLLDELNAERQYYRAAHGKGGQKVNTTATAARVKLKLDNELFQTQAYNKREREVNMENAEKMMLGQIEERMNRERQVILTSNKRIFEEELIRASNDKDYLENYSNICYKLP